MSQLACLLRDHHQALIQHYGDQFGPRHFRAIKAILNCRTPACGLIQSECSMCHWTTEQCRSCGHRNCPSCQYRTQQSWLARQLRKQLPVPYFMITFTLPAELRGFAFAYPKQAYSLLFQCASATLKAFFKHDPKLGDRLGMTGVLHTHNRKLDYHPHVHFVLPGGGYDRKHRSWICKKKRYLFNGNALARVFRGRFLSAMTASGYCVPKGTKPWVVQAKAVGDGEKALQYLSRYLYRGVIMDKNIVKVTEDHVTFRYQDSRTKKMQNHTEPVLQFLWKVLQHVLPKGFRRVRDFGFLQGNTHCQIEDIKRVLKAPVSSETHEKEQTYCCPKCGGHDRLCRFLFSSRTRLIQTTS